MPCLIRPIAPDEDLAALTDLIHRAYAPQAAKGLRYWGTHQSVEDTAIRLASGQGFLAETGGVAVGTITLRPPQPASTVGVYRDSHTWSFCQFAVAPECKGAGIGQALHQHAIAFAAAAGARAMALDTAATADALIAMYQRWGYAIAAECDWRPHTNYRSVVMTRPIERSPSSGSIS